MTHRAAGTLRPDSGHDLLESFPILPALIASTEAPINSTPNSSSVPFACRAIAAFSAVWPPRVASRASGRSRSITRRTISGVIGST